MTLPQNWIATTFENILNYEQPSAYIVKSTNYNDNYETPVLTAGKSFIIGYTNEKTGIYSQDLPVIIFDDFTCATQYVTFPFKVKSSAMKILQPVSEMLSKRYIYYFMQTIRHNVTTHKRYWISDYSKRTIPLPSLAEQHRIVAKIDALFSSLDKGVETLQTIQQQLRIYRQAVLKWAFEGKLTNVTVRKYARLQDLCFFITKGTTPQKEEMSSDSGDIPFIKVYNLTFSGILDFTIDPTFVSSDTHNRFLSRSKVLPGDVLMNIVGPPLGKVSIVPQTYDEFNINQAIARFRCNKELNNKFLAYFLLFDGTIEAISKKSKATAGQFNLTLEICRDIKIPLSDNKEQSAIVAAIESRLSVCDKLEAIVEGNLNKAQALKQSILKKAFAGQLVPQDPNDEPAEKLLERIKTERKSIKVKPKTTKKEVNKKYK